MATVIQTYHTSKKYIYDENEIRVHVDETGDQPQIQITTNDDEKAFVFNMPMTRKNMKLWVRIARLIEKVANDHMPEKDDETPF